MRKKIRKEKPFPAVRAEEIPFDLPDGWVWCRLGEIISLSSGDGLIVKDMIAGEVPVISGKRVYPLLTHLPPLPEQTAIVQKIEALMQTCTDSETQIKQSEIHATQLMQAVIKEAFEAEKVSATT